MGSTFLTIWVLGTIAYLIIKPLMIMELKPYAPRNTKISMVLCALIWLGAFAFKLKRDNQATREMLQKANRRIAMLESYVDYNESSKAPCDLTTFVFEEVGR